MVGQCRCRSLTHPSKEAMFITHAGLNSIKASETLIVPEVACIGLLPLGKIHHRSHALDFTPEPAHAS